LKVRVSLLLPSVCLNCSTTSNFDCHTRM
jgi:hypothetical protein